MTVHAFVDSPLRRRSPVLGVLGAVLALPSSFFVVAAIVDLARGAEDPTGALLGGACMASLLALGIAAMVYGFGKTSKPRAVTRAAAQRARDVGLATLDTSAPDAQQINVAAGWMLDGRYEDATRAYHQIAERFPHHRGTAASQIGACCYFLGRFEEAIGWYEHALQHGADPRMMQDNIDEARAALRG
ncbi:MAG: tetratricopeptide repeat protein [Sandaracinus sp.]|nr:tetratricopeptide repeat protein [Sandaracinus sp.]